MYNILVMFTIILFSTAFQIGDRISTQVKTQHDEFMTSFHDIPIDKMPRFRLPDSKIIIVNLPRSEELGHVIKLNPNENLKFSFSFANSKLLVPWTILFDASNKRSLNKLSITFDHDEFDVLRLTTKTQCKNRLSYST